MMAKNKNNSGFTLIEVVAVVGVLAVTSAILLVNNRLNELQLSLNKDVAVVANSISRAKALTLQGAKTSTCLDGGFGIHFEPATGNLAANPDKFVIFEDYDCNQVYDPSIDKVIADQGVNNLDLGLRFVTVTSGANYFIKDLFFYSSDARVKISGIYNNAIDPAGVIIISTESSPTSFMTLKITTTGQVSSKSGAYVNPGNFDNGIGSDLQRSGEGVNGGFFENRGDEEIGDGFGGEGEGLEENILLGENGCDPISCAGKTCADYNGCGTPCVICSVGQACIGGSCQACTSSCAGKQCGDDNGCGNPCTSCPNAGEYCNLVTKQCEVAGVELRIDTIDPPIGVK